MKRGRNLIGAMLLALLISAPMPAAAADEQVQQQLNALANEVGDLRSLVQSLQQARGEDLDRIEGLRDRLIERDLLNDEYVDQRIEDFSLFNTSRLFVSGYGTAGYTDTYTGPSTFGASYNPIFHFALGENLHLLAEPEFAFEEEGVEVDLEIMELDWFVNDYLTLVAGRFLLPFNAFGERLHPSYINKFPSPPNIYGHGHGGGGIVPVLRDIGVMARGGVELPFGGDGSKINYAFFAGNGARIEEHAVEEEPAAEHEEEGAEAMAGLSVAEAVTGHGEMLEGPPGIEFSENLVDNNTNKTVGGRIGILPIWNLEIGGSFMTGKYDDEGDLSFVLWGFDAEYHHGPFEVRGEYLGLERETDHFGDIQRRGAYGQVAYRLVDINSIPEALQRTELVTRIGRIFGDGPTQTQVALGINYYIRPSTVLKLGYEFNDGTDNLSVDRLLLQLAFGF